MPRFNPHTRGYSLMQVRVVAASTQDAWEYNAHEAASAEGSFSTLTNSDSAAIARDSEVAKRMVTLEANYYEDYGKALNEGARAGFECFMRYNPQHRLPLLGAESSGSVLATWTSGAECLSLRFTGRYALDYAVAFHGDQGLVRRWGRSNLATISGDCPHIRRLAAE